MLYYVFVLSVHVSFMNPVWILLYNACYMQENSHTFKWLSVVQWMGNEISLFCHHSWIC